LETIRTLIVDDEPRIRRGIERLVLSCGEGWEVVATAGDGAEAMEYLVQTNGAIDLLITDVKMPEMDGLTLIQEAKKLYTFYPLLISGYDDFVYVQTALREGALDYLLKPIDREQFRLRMMEVRSKITSGRLQYQKLGEMEREAQKLKISRQTQTLSYITSAGIDMTSLGYWVDEFPKGKYLLVCIRMDTLPIKTRSYTDKDWKAYFYVFENIVSEVVSNHLSKMKHHGWCWRGANSEFWTLLYSPNMQWEWDCNALELANQIRSSIQTYTPFSVSIAYGDSFDDLYLLPDAKRQALGLMIYRFLYGGNQVFRPYLEQQGGKMPDRRDTHLGPIAQRLKRSVEQANVEEAGDIARQLFDELDQLDSPVLLQSTVQNVIILIHSAGVERYGGIAHPGSVERELHNVNRAASVHELKQCVNRSIEQMVKDIRSSRDTVNMKPVEQAKTWIKDNLGEEITIKKIADQVHMNPTYFCEYFKIQTGETILDYLTWQRMEKVKDLLQDPSMKLQEISLRVGYHDLKYFSRLFKQWTGQTPSKYREQMPEFQGGEREHGIQR
jgi:two-component system response regulator YesN